MRLIVLGCFLLLLAVGISEQVFPLPLAVGGLVFGEAEVLLCLVAFPLLVVVEGFWSMVQSSRARGVSALLEAITEQSTGYQERAAQAIQKQRELSTELLEATERTEHLMAKIASQENAFASESTQLRDALRSAEAQRDVAHAQSAGKGKDVLHFLSRLQEKGRFVDFVMEDVGTCTDQQIGAAARYVHGGCRSVVKEYLDLVPVQEGEQGKAVTISTMKDPMMLRFIGRSALQFPVTGTLIHRGWKATRVSLPELSTSVVGAVLEGGPVITPAEVELR